MRATMFRTAAVIVFAACLVACPDPGPKDGPSLVPHGVDYEGTIVSDVPVMGARDEQGLDPLTAPPTTDHVVLASGVKVRVLVAKPEGARVEVLSGMQKGEKAWIRWKDLR